MLQQPRAGYILSQKSSATEVSPGYEAISVNFNMPSYTSSIFAASFSLSFSSTPAYDRKSNDDKNESKKFFLAHNECINDKDYRST